MMVKKLLKKFKNPPLPYFFLPMQQEPQVFFLGPTTFISYLEKVLDSIKDSSTGGKCKKKFNVREFLGAFVSRRTLRSPALTARKHMCDSLRLQLHQPHVANLTAAWLTVVVTHLHMNCSSFYLPWGMEARVELIRSRDRTRTSCTHERTCVGAANALTNWASQTDARGISTWSQDQ